ncbi:MAG: type II toxin-antitoxin system VapC family toxin [Nitrososphaerales archaeon]
MERLVIDSSVIVKWFSKEEDTDKALELRNEHINGEIELIVTPLLFCEVINALRYKPDFDNTKLKRAIESIYKLHMHIEPITKDLLIKSSEIAFSENVTLYDAIPVALAGLQHTVCITANERTQYERLRDKYSVKLLNELLRKER